MKVTFEIEVDLPTDDPIAGIHLHVMTGETDWHDALLSALAYDVPQVEGLVIKVNEKTTTVGVRPEVKS